MRELPYSLMANLEPVAGLARPPVHLWQPETVQDIDLTIRRDGSWHYLGTPIRRPRLVRLFSSVLRREGDDYYLVTPVEKCRITVEDVPFKVVLMAVQGEGEHQRLACTTDMAEPFIMDAAHPLRMAGPDDARIPYVHVRDGLDARISRNVYYQLADLMVARGGELGVWSGGAFHRMMSNAGGID